MPADFCRHLVGNTHTHTHTRLTALFPGLPGWASTRKVKPIWILLKQEPVSSSGISWAICKSAPCSRQIPCQHLTTQFFTGRMPFLPPNQQRQSTEGQFSPIMHYTNPFTHSLVYVFIALSARRHLMLQVFPSRFFLSLYFCFFLTFFTLHYIQNL